MANHKNEKKKSQKEINKENLEAGISIIKNHPLFGNLLVRIYYSTQSPIKKGHYSYVSSDGSITVNENESLTPKSWAYILAHGILHLSFGHFDADKLPGYQVTAAFIPAIWNMACDIYVTKFLYDIKFSGSIHTDPSTHFPGNLTDERKIYEYLLTNPDAAKNNFYGTAATGTMDMYGLEHPLTYDKSRHQRNRYSELFAHELARSVSRAVSTADGHDIQSSASNTPASRAARWFIDHYPLLGGLAAHFKLIEDVRYCQTNEIHIAAIDVVQEEVYVNPAAHFSTEEWQFILAHEYLHAGLQHHYRCQGRDPYLWNIACDYVINGWLHEMQIGSMPQEDLLYDESLTGLSAESIYDMIVNDLRKYGKLDTFRGFGKGDILLPPNPKHLSENGVTLDEFCRSALQQGLEYHQSQGRGLIPAGLIEDIRALSMPPIPWDVELANWFQVYFAPLEKHRTYARPSRRQASTPDIPRPQYTLQDIPTDSRTFGVVVDTSGSMSAKQIGMALGSIASYSAAHDVPFARVVFCDASAYDAGYLAPEDIAGRVQVKGRGGTVLQPGIDLLENASDFPKDGPILIITDGEIENSIKITHEHAWLLPRGGHKLPFRSKGAVFRFSE